MSRILPVLLLFLSLTAAGRAQNPYASYFYPDVTEQRVYVFKDTIGDVDSCFLIVYATDFKYKKAHVVQYYGIDGQLTEEFIYAYPELEVINYITVNADRDLNTVSVPKITRFPWNDRHLSRYTYHFPRTTDSADVLAQKPSPEFKIEAIDINVRGEGKRAVTVSDTLCWTWRYLGEEKKDMEMLVLMSYFAEGYGLVRFHDSAMKSDYILADIITVEDWRKRMKAKR